MKINGKELTKQEELAHYIEEVKYLTNEMNNTGVYLNDQIRHANKRIRTLKIEINIDNLNELLFKTKNAKDFDNINKKISNLKTQIKQIEITENIINLKL
jgi:TolA-binding protein